MQQIEGLLTRFCFLHARMQARLKQWHDTDQASYGYQQMSLLDMPYLHRIQNQLWDELDDCCLHSVGGKNGDISRARSRHITS